MTCADDPVWWRGGGAPAGEVRKQCTGDCNWTADNSIEPLDDRLRVSCKHLIALCALTGANYGS